MSLKLDMRWTLFDDPRARTSFTYRVGHALAHPPVSVIIAPASAPPNTCSSSPKRTDSGPSKGCLSCDLEAVAGLNIYFGYGAGKGTSIAPLWIARS